MFINLSGYVLNAINILPKGLANRRAAAGLVEKLAEVTEENAGRAGDPVASSSLSSGKSRNMVMF